MSITLDLGCKDCKISLWIGQGWPKEKSYIYSGEEDTMKALGKFLVEHMGHNLIFDTENAFIDDWTNLFPEAYLDKIKKPPVESTSLDYRQVLLEEDDNTKEGYIITDDWGNKIIGW